MTGKEGKYLQSKQICEKHHIGLKSSQTTFSKKSWFCLSIDSRKNGGSCNLLIPCYIQQLRSDQISTIENNHFMSIGDTKKNIF